MDATALLGAEAELRARLQAHLLFSLHSEHEGSWLVFLYLLQDWCLACSLLRGCGDLRGHARDDGTAVKSSQVKAGPGNDGTAAKAPVNRLELQLVAPEAVWRRELLGFVEMGGAETSAEEEAWEREETHGWWQVDLSIAEAEEGTHCLLCDG